MLQCKSGLSSWCCDALEVDSDWDLHLHGLQSAVWSWAADRGELREKALAFDEEVDIPCPQLTMTAAAVRFRQGFWSAHVLRWMSALME